MVAVMNDTEWAADAVDIVSTYEHDNMDEDRLFISNTSGTIKDEILVCFKANLAYI